MVPFLYRAAAIVSHVFVSLSEKQRALRNIFLANLGLVGLFVQEEGIKLIESNSTLLL